MQSSSENWQRVEELFVQATKLTPDERPRFLEKACGQDPQLRREVESLLKFDDDSDTFMEMPTFALAAISLEDEQHVGLAGEQLGPYKVVQEIGRGGMGAVYLAERADDEYRKHVAVKLVKRGFDTEEMRRRFRHERQILARLDHENIARLLDGGTTEDGRPFLVMEQVKGVPITRYCDAQRLSTESRLRLFLAVCEGVSYAHRNLVIHRDIKPANVLVTEEGVPKLLDFGIAKLLDPEESEQEGHTVTQLGVMTPEYASPEQVKGLSVTTATDVYSLGVLLYELLTGHRPYRLASRSPEEVARVICEQEPTRPSAAVATTETIVSSGGRGRSITPEDIGSARDLSPEKLRRRLAGDLDIIILTAIRKEPERRYASVVQLSEDIRRHLTGLPILARKDTFGYRGSKFVRRHRMGVAVATLMLVGLAIGVVAVGWQARVAARERDIARREKIKAERINAFLQEMLGLANPAWYSRNRS